MDHATIDDLLTRLAEPSTTVEAAEAIMARFDGHEVEAALPVFQRLHDATDRRALHAAARLLTRWRDRPVTQALVPALGALLRERAVGDLNKIAAAGVLEAIGQPVDYPALLGQLKDLRAVARESLEAALREADRPYTLANVVDRLAHMPRDQVLAVIDDIVAIEDLRAVPILVALAHLPDADVAVSAIAALDWLEATAAATALARVAGAHADETVRREAERTLERLDRRRQIPASEAARRQHGAGDSPRISAVSAYTSPVRAGDGGQLVVLAVPHPSNAAWQDVLTVYATTSEGIRECAALEQVTADRFAALRAECAAAGVPLAPAELPAALARLDGATARAMAGGGLDRVGHIVWFAFLDRV